MDLSSRKRPGTGGVVGDEKKEIAILGQSCEHGIPMIRINPETKTMGVGMLQPAPEGQPLPEGAEHVHLEHHHGNVFSLRTLAAGNGPAQVASSAYRNNYDTIFGTRPRGKQYLN